MKLSSITILFVTGVLYLIPTSATANNRFSQFDPSHLKLTESKNHGSLIFARRMGRMGCEGEVHRDDHNCRNQGRQHRRGMGHGRMHGMGRGPGLDGEAQCPQDRSTAKAPEAIYSKTNPLESTPENIEKGRLLFTLDAQPTCTVCHGSGNGLGMMSGGLNPPPRNFMCKETMQNISDGQLFWIIKNGSSGTGMPAFSDLNDEQIWQLVHYIRQLSK